MHLSHCSLLSTFLVLTTINSTKSTKSTKSSKNTSLTAASSLALAASLSFPARVFPPRSGLLSRANSNAWREERKVRNCLEGKILQGLEGKVRKRSRNDFSKPPLCQRQKSTRYCQQTHGSPSTITCNRYLGTVAR